MHLVLSPTYIGVQTISLKKIYKEKSFKNCKARKTSAKNYFGKKFLIYFLSVVMYMNAYAPAYIATVPVEHQMEYLSLPKLP